MKSEFDYSRLTLVDSEPIVHFGVVARKDYSRVLGEVRHNLRAKPAVVRVLEMKREIPVVEGYHWGDAIGKTGVNDVVVVGEGLLVDGSGAERLDAAP